MNRAPETYFGTEHLKAGLGTSAIRGGGVVVASQTLAMVIRMGSSIVLARLLTPADFGLVAMVISVTAALLIFKDLGLCDAVIQWPSPTHRQISTLFWVNLAVSAIITLALMVLSPLIAWFYHEPRAVGICIVWSLVLMIGGSSAQQLALLKRGMLFFSVSILTVVAAVVANGVAILLALRGAGYWSLVSREVLAEFVIAAGAWFLCTWRPGLPRRQSGIRPMLVFGGNTILSYIVRRSVRNLDRTLIGWRFGAGPVGYYHTAFELAALPAGQVSDSLRNVAVSALSKLRDEPEVYRRHYLRAVRTLAFLGFAATGFFVIVSEDLIPALLGTKWKEAGRLFGILGLSMGVSMIYLTHVWLHFSLGRADRLARWSGIEAAVIVAALMVGLPFGASGVAWAYASALYVLTIPSLWYAGRPIGLKVSEIVQAIWRPFVAAAGAAVLAWYIIVHSTSFAGHVSRILASGGCFLLFYLPLVVALSGGAQPITEFMSMLKKTLPQSRSAKTQPVRIIG